MIERLRHACRTLFRGLTPFAIAIPLALGTALSAADRDPPADTLLDSDAELFVQVQGLDQQLASPAGVQLRTMLAGLGLFDRTGASWRALADALRLEPDDAIHALLGGRFTLLANGVGDDAEPDDLRWACAMSIEPELGARVPRLLKAAPRASISGRTVFAIEDGRLSVMPLEGGRRLVVATAGADRLLRAAADLASQRTADNAATQGGALVLRRPDGSAVSGTIAPTRDGWDLRCSFIQPDVGDTITASLEPPGGMTRIDPTWFDNTTRHAAIAYAGPIAPDPDAPAPVGDSGLIGLGLLGTDPATLRKWTGIFMPVAPPTTFLKGGSDFGVLASGPDDTASAWFRVPEPVAAARLGDAHMCELLGLLGGDAVVSPDAPECTGGFPVAARRVDLPANAVSEGSVFAWGATSVRAGIDAPQSWWSMHAAAAGGGAPSLAPVLSSALRDPEVRFTLRPRLLLGRLATPGSGAAAPTLQSPAGGLGELARLRLVDWTLTPAPVRGFPATGLLRLRFHAPAGD